MSGNFSEDARDRPLIFFPAFPRFRRYATTISFTGIITRGGHIRDRVISLIISFKQNAAIFLRITGGASEPRGIVSQISQASRSDRKICPTSDEQTEELPAIARMAR